MWRYLKQRGAVLQITLLVLIGALLVFAMFDVDALRKILTDQGYKDLAPWVQVVASVLAIIAAVYIARIPIEQANREKEDLKNKSILLFWFRFEPMLKGDLHRVQNALIHFNNLRSYYDEDSVYEFNFNLLAERVMMMQTHNVNDYSAAYDYSPTFFIALSSAQKNLITIKRRIAKSRLVDDDANSSDFVTHAITLKKELKEDWFGRKEKDNEIVLKRQGKLLLESLREQERLISEICRMLDLKIGIDKELLR